MVSLFFVLPSSLETAITHPKITGDHRLGNKRKNGHGQKIHQQMKRADPFYRSFFISFSICSRNFPGLGRLSLPQTLYMKLVRITVYFIQSQTRAGKDSPCISSIYSFTNFSIFSNKVSSELKRSR